MEKKYSSEQPTKVERIQNGYKLSYLIHESSKAEILEEWKMTPDYEDGKAEPDQGFIDEHKYCYYTVDLLMGQWNYNGIVNAIIRDKYTADEMEAITNNMNAITGEFFNVLVTDGIIKATKYLVDSINSENTANFTEMQAWRAMAKRTAKEIFV